MEECLLVLGQCLSKELTKASSKVYRIFTKYAYFYWPDKCPIIVKLVLAWENDHQIKTWSISTKYNGVWTCTAPTPTSGQSHEKKSEAPPTVLKDSAIIIFFSFFSLDWAHFVGLYIYMYKTGRWDCKFSLKGNQNKDVRQELVVNSEKALEILCVKWTADVLTWLGILTYDMHCLVHSVYEMHQYILYWADLKKLLVCIEAYYYLTEWKDNA